MRAGIGYSYMGQARSRQWMRGQVHPVLSPYQSFILLLQFPLYNCLVLLKFVCRLCLIIALLTGIVTWYIKAPVALSEAPSASYAQVTAADLILAMNTLRVSHGLPPLIEDPIINAVAQATAEYMAAKQMSSHIGNVRGRLAAAGYGGGATVWATENFAVGNHTIDEIMVIWSDASHMLPAVNPAYCHVGAGVAKSASGQTYYVLQAAYTSAKTCGEYKLPEGGSAQPGGSPGIPQVIIPVKIATPDADGRIFHVVQAGQSFWAIAVAYRVTIRDLEVWNNLSRDQKLQIGQRLFIPSSNTKGYATPTPVGMVQVSTPDADGKIVHVVQPYNTLITIAKAYGVKVETILANNGIQVDWPLQIGQKLIINPGSATPSPTPRPLTPIERLTPESDGKYYHTVSSGETLSWIAGYYGISLSDLMAWNGLNASSILHPGQKLILEVTPPATETPTPAPATATPTATLTPPLPTLTLSPTSVPQMSITVEVSTTSDDIMKGVLIVSVALTASGLVLAALWMRKKQPG